MARRIRYVGPTLIELHTEVLFLPTGPIGRWKRSVERTTREASRLAAPVNKRANKNPASPSNPYGGTPRGHLRSTIHSDVTGSLKRFWIDVYASAPYALFVHQGTGPIFSRGPGGRFGRAREGMVLPANVVGGKVYQRGRPRVQRVSGQDAQPFLHEGMAIAARAHSSLRPGAASMRVFQTRRT